MFCADVRDQVSTVELQYFSRMYIRRMKFFHNLKATFKNRFKKKKNNNIGTRKRGEKSFEEVMAILKDIKKLYEDNNIKVIEDARKREAPKNMLSTYKTSYVWSSKTLLKDYGISNISKYSKSDIRNHVRTDEEQKIFDANRSIHKAELAYMCKNPTQYPGVAKMAKKDPTQCDPDYF